MIAEFEAVKVMFEAVPMLASKVRDSAFDEVGKVARGTYLVLYGAGPDGMDDGRDSAFVIPCPESDAEYSIPAKAVGTDPGAVMLILDAARSLVGQKPVVAGRRCDPVTVSFEAVKVDNTVSPPLYFSDFWVEFWSRRG